MNSDRVLINVSYGLMRLGVAVFLFPFFWQFVKDPGFDSSGSNISISILLTALYITVIFILFVISKENFNVFGFAIVIISSISMFLYILFKIGMHDGLAPYFLLICISVYFMTKVNRSR